MERELKGEVEKERGWEIGTRTLLDGRDKERMKV